MMVFVVVGKNSKFNNVSARAVYSTRAQALAHINDAKRMWFDDEAVVVELELDAEAERCVEDHEGGAGCDVSFPCYNEPAKCIRGMIAHWESAETRCSETPRE